MSLPTLPVTISIFFFPFIVFINSPGYLFELILFFLDWLRGVKADFFLSSLLVFSWLGYFFLFSFFPFDANLMLRMFLDARLTYS